MKSLLVSGFGASVYVDKRKLFIENRLKGERHEFYPHQIDYDSIIIDGHTGSITFEALRWLMKHDIHLSLLNWNGNLLSTVLPKEPKSGRLKIKQYSKYLNELIRFDIASKVVYTKILHLSNLLNELAKYYDEINANEVNRFFAREYEHYQKAELDSEDIRTRINSLMNYEGRIATTYWDNLTRIFNKLYPDFRFKGRKNKSYSWNMNASDEINALLNYGYAILESQIRKHINAVGVDTTIGFLHEIAATKTPLVYDIQELFRWIIDLSVIQLLEERKLKKSDFIITENYHTRLRERSAKMLIEKIMLNFNRKVAYKGKNYSYETILQDNIQELANFILDKRKELKFNIPEIRIERDDSIEVKKKILSMPVQERKRLGINKSTLWYQKKKVTEGKKIKLYTKVLSKIRN